MMMWRAWNAYWRFWNRFGTPGTSTWELIFFGSLVVTVGNIFVMPIVELLTGLLWLGAVTAIVVAVLGVITFISILAVPASYHAEKAPASKQ